MNSYCHANDSIGAKHQRQAMLNAQGRLSAPLSSREMPDPLLTADDLALRPGGGVRSPWLRDALAAEGDPPPLPGLSRDRSCDVAIVGGGYTGLWTALQLKERAPEREVVLLEQDICGGGPSGRNGGFVNAWWDELDTLEELYGAEPAISAARALSESVRAIGSWCEQHDVDAHYRHAGMLVVSTTAPHDDRPLGSVAVAQRLGVPEEFVALTPDEVQARCASPRFRNGAFMRDGATVQPALLARGLRRRCAGTWRRHPRAEPCAAAPGARRTANMRCWSTDRMGRIGSRPTRWSWR